MQQVCGVAFQPDFHKIDSYFLNFVVKAQFAGNMQFRDYNFFRHGYQTVLNK